MNSAGVSFPVRPLGIGEIFDRAVTLYVRYFGLFTLIMLVVILPLVLLSFFSLTGNSFYQQILQQVSHPRRTAPSASMEISQLLQIYAVLFLVAVLRLLLMPFAAVATAASVSALYDGRRPVWRDSYLTALRRWPAILGAEAMTVLILGAVVVGGALVFGVIVAGGVFAARGSTFGIILFAVVMIATALAWILAIVLSSFSMGFAFNAIGIERAGVFDAIGLGFARIFSRGEIGRAALIVLALAAIAIVLEIVFALLAGLALSVTHSLVIYGLMAAPVSLITGTFSAILFAVYYFDVRVRREGLDVQSALDRLE